MGTSISTLKSPPPSLLIVGGGVVIALVAVPLVVYRWRQSSEGPSSNESVTSSTSTAVAEAVRKASMSTSGAAPSSTTDSCASSSSSISSPLSGSSGVESSPMERVKSGGSSMELIVKTGSNSSVSPPPSTDQVYPHPDWKRLRDWLCDNYERDLLMPVVHKKPVVSHLGGTWSWDKYDAYDKNRPHDYCILLQDLCVVDVDNFDVVEALEQRFPILKNAPCENTRKGRHYFFVRSPRADKWGYYDKANQGGETLVDFKTRCSTGTGGVIVVAPSTNYSWVRPLWDGSLVTIPDNLLDYVASPVHVPASDQAAFEKMQASKLRATASMADSTKTASSLSNATSMAASSSSSSSSSTAASSSATVAAASGNATGEAAVLRGRLSAHLVFSDSAPGVWELFERNRWLPSMTLADLDAPASDASASAPIRRLDATAPAPVAVDASGKSSGGGGPFAKVPKLRIEGKKSVFLSLLHLLDNREFPFALLPTREHLEELFALIKALGYDIDSGRRASMLEAETILYALFRAGERVLERPYHQSEFCAICPTCYHIDEEEQKRRNNGGIDSDNALIPITPELAKTILYEPIQKDSRWLCEKLPHVSPPAAGEMVLNEDPTAAMVQSLPRVMLELLTRFAGKVAIAGGAVVGSCAKYVPTGHDLDVFFFGVGEAEATDMLAKMEKAIMSTGEYEEAFQTFRAVSFNPKASFAKTGTKQIQIIARLHTQRSLIIQNFDYAPVKALASVDPATGRLMVEAFPCWIEALRHMALWVEMSPTCWGNSSPIRIFKYLHKGFEVAVPSLRREGFAKISRFIEIKNPSEASQAKYIFVLEADALEKRKKEAAAAKEAGAPPPAPYRWTAEETNAAQKRLGIKESDYAAEEEEEGEGEEGASAMAANSSSSSSARVTSPVYKKAVIEWVEAVTTGKQIFRFEPGDPKLRALYDISKLKEIEIRDNAARK